VCVCRGVGVVSVCVYAHIHMRRYTTTHSYHNALPLTVQSLLKEEQTCWGRTLLLSSWCHYYCFCISYKSTRTHKEERQRKCVAAAVVLVASSNRSSSTLCICVCVSCVVLAQCAHVHMLKQWAKGVGGLRLHKKK
jgi:hypothetical protein